MNDDLSGLQESCDPFLSKFQQISRKRERLIHRLMHQPFVTPQSYVQIILQ